MTLSMQAAAAPTDALRVGRKGVILALSALALIVAWMWTRIGHWGVAQDAANQLYVAWLTSRGAVIYRDVFEINWPGNFFLH
jgi:hypothetical protein